MDYGLIRQELNRVLDHPLFTRARVLRDMLCYLVECRLAGQKVDEAGLAVRIFGKQTDSFHPYKHANVRVQFRNLRLKLAAYYVAEPGAKVKFRIIPYEVIFEIADPAAAEARRLLNEARWLFESRFPADLLHAIGLVQQIVEQYPHWSPALVALNQLHISVACHGGGAPLENLRKAEIFADRAIEAAPDNGMSFAAKAATEAFLHWRWDAAEELFQRAIQLLPAVRYDHWYHSYLVSTQRPQRAAELIEESLCALERPWPSSQTNLGIALMVAGKAEAAERELLRAGKLNPEDWSALAWLAVHYWQKGEMLKAAYTQTRAMTLARRSPPGRYFDVTSGAFLGSPKNVKVRPQEVGGITEVGKLVGAAVLGQWDLAAGAIERMYENRYPLVHYFPQLPLLHPLWSNTRFREAHSKTGLSALNSISRAKPA